MKKSYLVFALLSLFILVGCKSRSGMMAYGNPECSRPLGRKTYVFDFEYGVAHLTPQMSKDVKRAALAHFDSRRVCVLGRVVSEGGVTRSREMALLRAKSVANEVAKNGSGRSEVMVDIFADDLESVFFMPVRPMDERRRVEVWFLD